MAPSETTGSRVRTPFLPTWSEVRDLLRVWDATPRADIDAMRRSVSSQMGTPQQPVDWSDPDSWIPQRLSGAPRALAERIWVETEHRVNPRYVDGSMLLTRNHKLVATGPDGINRMTDRGHEFMTEGSAVEREIDEIEGIPFLLRLIAKKTRPKRQDLLPDWIDYLAKHSRFAARSTAKSTLAYRARNVIARGFVQRDGITYTLTRGGQTYLALVPAEADDRQRLMEAVESYNEEQRKRLRERLGSLDPYVFEHLVRDLLTEMGYEDATVTKQTGDKGIDVVANVEIGITSVREVVQVKRVRGNLGRNVLDELRGVLPFHGAIRGTVITTGGFSKGCTEVATFPGAAPLTLIDGDRLIDLLIDHGVGVAKSTVEVLELVEPDAELEGEEDAEP
jgi:restriction system protein